jgi:hypothetical protein
LTVLWLLAPFIHTPPHPPPDVKWQVSYARREEMTPDGTYCAWEAESLSYAGKPIWSEDPPEGESWCAAPFEASRWIDVQGEDGPFLSVELTDWKCCPDVETERCVTYDVRSGEPVTLEAYDPRHYAWRARRLQRALDRRQDGGGWIVDPTGFLVGGGHVRVCATRGAESIQIPVR